MKSLKITYRLFALTMAFVMFATSANFALDMHFCQGKLKSISLFGQSDSCCQKANSDLKMNCSANEKLVETSNDCSISQTKCCNNQSVLLQSDQDQPAEIVDVLLSDQLQKFVIAYVAVFIQKDFIQKSTPTFLYYQSPIISRDIYVLFQSFLL